MLQIYLEPFKVLSFFHSFFPRRHPPLPASERTATRKKGFSPETKSGHHCKTNSDLAKMLGELGAWGRSQGGIVGWRSKEVIQNVFLGLTAALLTPIRFVIVLL